ncbi:MAG TPA: Mrp/NBP35 family ATP-binding protein [candidate division Zixibacteria bacterium]|nr:Mrp/NBP35 family ATP-binding protein [candidate division Zixibacteria bacterium]
MSERLTNENIMAVLSQVKDPEIGRDLVSLGMVKSIEINGSAVDLTVELTTPACPLKAKIESDIVEGLESLGASAVRVDWAANVKRSFGGPAADLIPGVKNTVAVASGKGGVGKTTVAVNLAVSLARDGARVGLLDADITGPNVPLMMGTVGAHVTGANGRVNPVVSHGVKMMSIQYFLTGDAPVIWRGPLIHSAIQQFLRDVEWGELDYLVIDLPPGTGDAALSISQLIPLSGAVIVTTPQEVSLMDARKAIAMFTKVNVRTLGVVENMSSFICPDCGSEHDIFGSGGGEKIARELQLDVLGRIPLEPAVRTGGDAGVPITSTQHPAEATSAAGAALRELARSVAGRISVLAAPRAGAGAGAGAA